MSLTILFEYITPAANGNLYSANPGGDPSQPIWAKIPDFTNVSGAFSVNIQQSFLTPASGAVVTLVGTLPTGWTYNASTTVLSYDNVGVAGPLAVHWHAVYNSASADSNTVKIQGIGPGGTTAYNPSGVRLALVYIGTSGNAWPGGSASAYQQYAAAVNFDIQGGWYTLGSSLLGGSWKNFNATITALAPANSRAGAFRYYITDQTNNASLNNSMNPMLTQGPITYMAANPGWWAWQNARAQSGHVLLSYGGQSYWTVNQTDQAPADGTGRIYEEMYADEMYKWVWAGASYFPTSDQDPNAAGIFHDNWMQQPESAFDYNQSGVVTQPSDAAFQQAYRNGLVRGVKRYPAKVLRLGNVTRMAMPGGAPNTGQTGVLHGGVLESQFGAGNSVITWNGWGGFLSQYNAVMAACLAPKLVLVSHDNMRSDGSDQYQGAHKAQRFGLTATLLLNGYYFTNYDSNYEFYQAGFWFDEWSFDVNGVCYQYNGTAGSVLPGRTTLGLPTSAIGGVSGNGAYKIINGLYVRLWYNAALGVNWASICYPPVNSTNIPGGTLTLNASDVGSTSFKRLTGNQDSSVNNGSTSSSVTIAGGYNGQIVKVIP